jgi:CshA-type fibril repeat protein
MKKHYLLTFLLLASFLVVSCDNEDDYQPIDDLPVATDDTVNSTLTTAVEIPVLDNDTTGDEVVPTSVSIVNGTDTNSNGTLDQLIVPAEGTWQVNASTGTITFTPLSTFVGNPTAIKYTVKDAENNVSNEANVTINALPIVSVDLTTVPYPKLSDYHFFVGNIKDQVPSLNVLPYEPASALFSDYAHKKDLFGCPKEHMQLTMEMKTYLNFRLVQY